MVEIKGLKDLVWEFRETNALSWREPWFDRVSAKHYRDSKMPSKIPKEGKESHWREPVAIVENLWRWSDSREVLAFTRDVIRYVLKYNIELPSKRVRIFWHCLCREGIPLCASTWRISNRPRSTSDLCTPQTRRSIRKLITVMLRMNIGKSHEGNRWMARDAEMHETD